MKRKTFNLIAGVVGGLSTISVAVVTYFSPGNATAINASIGIGATAIVEICSQFVEE